MSEPDVIAVALQCAEALEVAGVGYFLGGSLASSLQGEPRATNDIDFVIDLRLPQLPAFVQALGPDFDVDEESLRDAVRQGASWNIFHLPSVTKVDLFLLRPGDFDRSEFERRRRVVLTPEGKGLFIKSPEDSVLRKLLWFREGGELSTTQWRDIVQVLRVTGGQMELGYLDAWAERLGVAPLLARAWTVAK
ncbi:hypothetical protein [Pyxidicoccus xibeiensis]|uniref:hypothetical protein n=1 Tax=Pyxidicoccus xibeiensis TaxID=2906759 RepID=UPI0020A75CCB|nr:hypothetical protein [Pyxidicoccus xibeiensis]MCP3136753.1 hypothetical protein [Pyxidicoccus xibeiensis]